MKKLKNHIKLVTAIACCISGTSKNRLAAAVAALFADTERQVAVPTEVI
jgi:hypothetical protein